MHLELCCRGLLKYSNIFTLESKKHSENQTLNKKFYMFDFEFEKKQTVRS